MRQIGIGVLGLAAALATADPAGAVIVGGWPAPVRLAGEQGGRVNGEAWSSLELTGRVHAVFYVDPDVRDLNEHVSEALNRERFPLDRYGVVAIVNLAATWKPNWLLERLLAAKQRKYPRAVYVKDRNRTLVRVWGLADNNSHILVFGPDGRVLFSRHGKFSNRDTAEFIELIRAQVKALGK